MRRLRPGRIAPVLFAALFLVAPCAEEPASLRLAAESVTSRADWERIYRPAILKRMEEVMGRLPRREESGRLNVKIEEEVDCGEYLRQFLTYESDPGGVVPAYLLIPKAVRAGKRKTHGILCLHQTRPEGHKVVVGLTESPPDEYGVDLVKRGYVCLAPAYPLLANYAPDLKKLGYESGTMKAIWDNMRGLDLLETLPYVKSGQFGAIGHSLGGHNSLYTAAFDKRIKVVVTSCGFDSYRDYMGGNIRGWTHERYMPRLLNYPVGNVPFDFHEVLAAIAPRMIYVSAPTGDTNFKWRSVDRVVAAARPVYELYRAHANLMVDYPEVGHHFPEASRKRAYQIIERVLPPLK